MADFSARIILSAEIAEAKAIDEYEKFRVRQELEYKSDFDQ